ncbi:MAG: methyltransferase domain-containing protein [Gemmatimonadetes bacterium]|nr:methyltransferase domain-containing protein [Gemmatimonadota bacterium]
MQSLESIIRVARSFDHAADHHDHPANTLWSRVGRQLVVRAGVRPGMAVLDAGCGSGASAIPAAQRVGAEGAVVAIDLSSRLLAIGRARAQAHRLRHLHFLRDDMRTPPVPHASQDVVLCGLALHLVPNLAEGLLALWETLRPGGTLTIAVLGRDPFAPAHQLLMDALHREGVVSDPRWPWDRLADAASLHRVFASAGLPEPEVQVEAGTHPIPTPEAWWMLVLGSDYRWAIDRLDPAARERVRRDMLSRLAEQGVRCVRSDVLYATARAL